MQLHRLISTASRATAALRRFAVRHQRLQTVIIVVAAAMTSVGVWQHLTALDQARSEWGATTLVWVAETDHAPDDPLRARQRSVPSPLVPAGALVADSTPTIDGEVAQQRVSVGEIVTSADISLDDEPIPADWRIVAVGQPSLSDIRVGDSVDVAADGVIVATEARVVSMHDESVHIAVAQDDAATVAFAVAAGNAVLLGVP